MSREYDDMPSNFARDATTQRLDTHVANLAAIGYDPQNIDKHERLRDLYCRRTETTFECKTDYYAPNNLCIELASNLKDVPQSLASARRITGGETYRHALDYLSEVWTYADVKLSVGLAEDLEIRHSLSYLFSVSGVHLVFDIRRLQRDVIHPALNEQTCPILFCQSSSAGSFWHSMNLLVPVCSATIAAATLPSGPQAKRAG